MTRLLPILLASALFAAPAYAQAQDATAQADVPAPSMAPLPRTPEKKSDPFKPVWDRFTLHKDKNSEFKVIGRLHLDHYLVDAEQGNARDLTVRRARIGAQGKMRDFEAKVEADLNLEGGPLYNRLTDAYIAYRFSDAARLGVGKQSVKFTLDGATSSNELLTIDRSNVANNFWFTDEYMPGVTMSGKSGKWAYNSGVFSGGRSDKDFGNFDGGYFVLGSLGRDFGDALGVKRAVVRADYVYNEPDADSDATRKFEHIGALVFILDDDRWGFSGDIVSGDGYLGQSDGWGATALPWYSLTEKLQLVGRYTYVKSDELNGVRIGRYENAVTSGRGDRYHELYGGLNYLIYGNKLKLQTGVTYADMRDRGNDGGAYQGWSWTSALRVSW